MKSCETDITKIFNWRNQKINELGKEFNENISSGNDDEIKYMKNNLNK